MRIGNVNARILYWVKIAAIVLALAPFAAQAGTNGFIVPTFRGTVDSQFGYWENFTVAFGSPGNLADQPGATTGAVLTQSHPAAMVLESGNIYNPGGASVFSITNSTPFTLGTVVLQIRTAGSELNYNSVSLSYMDTNNVTQTLAPLFRYELNRAAGGISSVWQWDLAGLGINNYSVFFNASGAHLSLDSVTLDTTANTNFIENVAFLQQPFNAKSQRANISRWSYLASDFSSGTRTTASTFGALGNAPDFDSRDAQYLVGWNTTNRVPAGQGTTNYLIKRARVTLTIASGTTYQYTYTGKLRDCRTYFPTNDLRYVAPTTTNSPVELFGAGFRGGFTNESEIFVPWASTNYPQTGPWAIAPNAYYESRVAYSAGFNTNGVLVDVANNIGDDGTNEIANPFEVAPFAVGQTTNVTEGQVMPTGSQLVFDINLDDPLIYSYLQKGLHDGNLSFMVSCLANSVSQSPPFLFPAFYTIFSPLAGPKEFPLLDIEGEIVRTSADSDADGLSDDWENFYFGSLASSATTDPDGDLVNNLAEYQAGTIPTVAANSFKMLSVQQQLGVAEVRFAYAPGRQYSVKWSSDLQNWQTETNPALFYSSDWLAKTGTNLVYPSPVFAGWRDTNAAAPFRFYHVGAR